MASLLSNNDIKNMSDEKILSFADKTVKKQLANFIKEFNKREWEVRINKQQAKTFEDYISKLYKHQKGFGYGFVVDNKPVPYFHPNRSFHDEIIWLNSHLYYEDNVSFEDKLINSAIVKFYGPARTLDIITGTAEDLNYLIPTNSKYINFDLLEKDMDYEFTLMSNVEKAFANKEKIWGTTELRTSLQIAARNYCRENPSSIDILNINNSNKLITELNLLKEHQERKMRPSDMIHWVKYLSKKWVPFFKNKPTMEQSFNFLTLERGIGNYYGYHFSSNLARMPGIGSSELIDAEYYDDFKKLQNKDKSLTHGNLDENADYVVAGPGATATLKKLFPDMPINTEAMMKYIIAIRNHQEDFFEIAGNTQAEIHLKEASELGRFTTFGIEISCCQFNVFERNKTNKTTALKRAMAPISQITNDAEFCNINKQKQIIQF
jgi:hypothetical protein